MPEILEPGGLLMKYFARVSGAVMAASALIMLVEARWVECTFYAIYTALMAYILIQIRREEADMDRYHDER